MAGKQVQRRRGSTAQHAVFTGAVAEITVDTDKKVQVVHDGVTPGGFPQASARDIVTVNGNVTAAQAAADAAQATADAGAAAAATADAKAVAADGKATAAQADVDALEVVVADNAAIAVTKTAQTGAAHMPTGTNAQRPGVAQEGDFRFNSQLTRFEGYQNGQWAQVGGDSLPVFFTTWWPNRAAVPAGFVVADGQLLNRATYPDASNGVIAGNVPVATDANWLGVPTERGKYTLGNGTTTFRMPDYNGKTAGSLGAVVQRGDGVLSAGTNGLIQADAFQNHIVQFNLANISGGATGANFTSLVVGASTQLEAATGAQGFRLGVSNLQTAPGYGNVRIDTETRALNVTGCWVVKLFGAVINPGSADAAQLSSDLGNLVARMNTAAQVDKGYISGLQMVFVSTASIQVTPGCCYMPSLGRVYESPVTLAATPPAGVTGLAHIYLYDNLGTPALEFVATDSVAYYNDARTKIGDASRRYLGSVLLLTGSAYKFYHFLKDSRISYMTAAPGGPPFALLSGGTSNVAAVVNPSAVVPSSATHLSGLYSPNGAAVFWGNEDMSFTLSGSSGNWFTGVNGGYSQMDLPLSRNTTPRRLQYVALAGASAFCAVNGYLFQR